MTRPCFKLLCQNIIAAVGESTFKSEVYIPYFLDQPYTFQCSCQVSIYLAQKEASGGYLCGEVKLAITLRILAGGDSLDLGALFDISPCYCKNILNYVLLNLIIKPNLGMMDVEAYLSNPEELQRVSKGFSTRSNGVLKGAIGAIDGWLVNIVKPSTCLDNLKMLQIFLLTKGSMH